MVSERELRVERVLLLTRKRERERGITRLRESVVSYGGVDVVGLVVRSFWDDAELLSASE